MITDAAPASSIVSHKCSPSLAADVQESCHFLFVFSFLYTGFAFRFSLHFFFLEADCSSNVMWNEFALVWTEISNRESEAVDLDLNMEVNKR